MLTKYKKSVILRKMEKIKKIIYTIVVSLLFVLAVYFFVKLMIASKYMDDEEMFLYGFGLFGETCAVVMLRIFINDIFDIWRKKKK